MPAISSIIKAVPPTPTPTAAPVDKPPFLEWTESGLTLLFDADEVVAGLKFPFVDCGCSRR